MRDRILRSQLLVRIVASITRFGSRRLRDSTGSRQVLGPGNGSRRTRWRLSSTTTTARALCEAGPAPSATAGKGPAPSRPTAAAPEMAASSRARGSGGVPARRPRGVDGHDIASTYGRIGRSTWRMRAYFSGTSSFFRRCSRNSFSASGTTSMPSWLSVWSKVRPARCPSSAAPSEKVAASCWVSA